jgi:GNAT superfamily N-acetyltransferase
MTDIIIEPFDGDQAVADEIAALHLQIRLDQRAEGINFLLPDSDIYDSQKDLKNMTNFYLKPGGNFWIARDHVNGRIAGFIGLRHESGQTGVLKRLAVLPEYRRRGIARELVRTLVDWAKEQRFATIMLGTGKNEKARSIYLNAGFVVTRFSDNGNDLLMRLEL